MKLWQKSNSSISEQIEAFTVGKDRDLDLYLAKYDILGSLAHTAMLAEVGLLAREEKATLHQALQQIMSEVERGEFQIEEGVEDVHSQVDRPLTLSA